MDLATARQMTQLTSAFYAREATSFDETRQAPWPGWRRVLDEAHVPDEGGRPLRVLDLACGNLRFPRYLASQGVLPETWAVDSCDELERRGEEALASLPDAPAIHYQHLDVTQALYDGASLAARIQAPPADLAVCFGFLHHVPLPEHRAEVLRALVRRVRPGGVVAVSLWQFWRSARIMAKAQPVPGGDKGDYLLGWADDADAARYCHAFSEEEVDELASSVAGKASELARFSSDGRQGDLNRYLLLRRRQASATEDMAGPHA